MTLTERYKNLAASLENLLFAYAKTKVHISCAVTAQADKRLCFHYIDSTIPLLPKSEVSSLKAFSEAVQPVCVGLVRDPEDRFSLGTAHI